VVRFEGATVLPSRQVRRSPTERVYPTPADAFELSVIDLIGACDHWSTADPGPEILFCAAGEAEVEGVGEPPLRLERGASAVVLAGLTSYRLTGRATLYKVAVPEGRLRRP